MDIFPVSNSILSSEHLVLFVKEKYRLNENSTCQLIKNWVNDTYLIQDDLEKYIFRIYRFNWRTEIEIAEELRLINLLKDKNISVSYPILDIEEKYIQEFPAPEGKRFGVLFSFAEGEKQLNVSADIHFDIGKMMAQIHQNSEGVKLERITYTPQVLLFDSFEKIKLFLDEGSKEYDFIKKTQQYIYNFFENVNHNQIRKGAVHLDIWADNLNIDKNNRITLFDFDFCGNGGLVFDIAFHAVMLFILETDEKKYLEKLNHFYQGYESVLVISEEEKRIIPEVGAALLFYYLGFQCERFSTVFVNPIYVKGFINSRIKRLADSLFHKY